MSWLRDVDATVLAALLAAFSAIVAPVITTWINNRHQYRMKKLEMVQEERIRAIQEYAESCSNYIAHQKGYEKTEYSKSYGKIFLYADKKHWKSIQSIHRDIAEGHLQDASEKLASVCQSLASDMNV